MRPNTARFAFAGVAALASPAAFAQIDAAPTGPFVIAAVGQAKYTFDPGIIVCYCRDSSHTTAAKLGAGYRFGVTAVEAWALDFGRADFAADSLSAAMTSRIRGGAVTAAWTARFGPVFDATWRVGGAELRLATTGQPSTTALRPLFGMSGGLRVSDAASLELSADITRARDSEGFATDVWAWWLGMRWRF